MRYAHITGWGKFLPDTVLTNDDLSKFVDTSDAWIRERTGIAARRIAGRRDTNANMAVAAAINALDVAGLSGSQLDLIIVATSTPDYVFPATACAVQDALGAARAGAFDLSAACSGFVYGLGMAADSIRAGSSQHVLVIGSEVMSRIIDWSDRNTCVLFGDGAGAVVLSASDQPGGVLSTVLRADGSGGDLLMVRDHPGARCVAPDLNGRAPASREDASSETAARNDAPRPEVLAGLELPSTRQTILMNGREVFRFATRAMDRATREVMHRAGWLPENVDLIVPHQANIRIIESASKALGIPTDRFYSNIQRYGNTSAASIPIALCEAVDEGRLRPNDRLIIVGFGSGLTWAASAVQWGPPPPMSQRQRLVNRVRYGVAGVRSRARRALRSLETQIFGAPETDTPTVRLVSPKGPAGKRSDPKSADRAPAGDTRADSPAQPPSDRGR